MPNYICKVITPQGQIIKVKLKEEDKITCLKKLKKNGMKPIEIKRSLFVPNNVLRKISASISAKKKKENTINLSKDVIKSINIEDIKSFSQEFLFLRQSNFSNTHALKTIITNTENQNLKKILKEILKENEKEIYIYETMEKYNQIFPLIYINFIKNGELTGLLDEGLENAIAYLDYEEKLINVMQEKIFPYILLIFSSMLVMFLSIVIGIPLIQDLLFNINMSLYLPLITRIVFKICNIIIYRWYIFVILIFLCIAGIIVKFRKQEEKYKLDEFKYKNKFFGKLFYLLDFSRITRCLMVNIKNKIRIQDSLEICKSVVKNTYMLNTIEKSINGIFKGKSWIDAFIEDKILNVIVIELIRKNSKLKNEELMAKTVMYIEMQMNKEIEKLIVKITEISYLILGVLFLIYIVTVLLPSISVYISNFLLF